MRQPCFLQQPYWCDGLGASASALDAWVEAGLPLRAVVHLKAPKEGEQAKDTPSLIAGAATLTAAVTNWSTPTMQHCSLHMLYDSILLPHASAYLSSLKQYQVKLPTKHWHNFRRYLKDAKLYTAINALCCNDSSHFR